MFPCEKMVIKLLGGGKNMSHLFALIMMSERLTMPGSSVDSLRKVLLARKISRNSFRFISPSNNYIESVFMLDSSVPCGNVLMYSVMRPSFLSKSCLVMLYCSGNSS